MNKTRMNIFFILIKKTKGYIIWVFHNQRFLIELPLIEPLIEQTEVNPKVWTVKQSKQ